MQPCPTFRESLYIYSFGARLGLLGGRALQCVGHYVESVRLMQAAWREVGVSLCALLHRAIARSNTRCAARAYRCVNSVKQPVCAFIEVYTEGSQDRTHGKVSSTYVYMHKCAEECRIARRSDRTRCTEYLKDVGSNSLHSRSQDPAARNTKIEYMHDNTVLAYFFHKRV